MIEIMTNYNDLSFQQKIKFRKELLEEVGEDKFLEELQPYKEGHLCSKCFMVWYNCLCSHED